MIIIQVTNKVFIVFSTEEILLDLHLSKEWDFYCGKFFFQLQYHRTLKLLNPLLCDNNFLCFIMFHFFDQVDILH